MSILKSQLVNVVRTQDEYLVDDHMIVTRDLTSQIKIDVPKALIITGVRRSGKSTLLKYFFQKNKKNVGYLHFDDPRLHDFDVDDFYLLEELWNEKKYYQFDEIQHIKSWEVYVRQAVERKKRISITGSNAQLLSKELGTYLTGRHISYELFPFSYMEFLKLVKKKDSKSAFDQYKVIGGFPEPILYPITKYHNDLFKDIVQRDIAVRFGIRNLGDLMNVALHLINNIARLFSFTKIAKSYGIKSVKTVSNYVKMLEDAYMIFTIPKFSYSAKKQLINNKKVYLIDHAFARANSTQLHDDHGRVLENMVFMQLRRKHQKISYFKEKGECDFIVQTSKGIEIYQVCHKLDRYNYDREIEGLKEAMTFFKLKSAKIITDNQAQILDIDKTTKIKLIPFRVFASNA